MGRYFLIFLLIGLSGKCFGQGWPRIINLNSNSTTCIVAESYDKGLFFGVNGNNIMLSKTDVNGNILWQKTIGKDLIYPYLNGITSTSDGGVALTGVLATNSTDTSNDVFLLKLNACGQMEWSKIYKLNQNSVGGSIKQLKNGDFVVSALVSISNDTLGNYYNSWVFRTNTTGAIKWQKFDNLYFQNMIIDQSNNILTTGFVYYPYPGFGGIRAAVNKTDSTGKKLWNSIYNSNSDILSQANTTVVTNDKNNLTFGAIRNLYGPIDALYLIKYDFDGNALWGKFIGDTLLEEDPIDMISMTDNTCLIAYYTGKIGHNDGQSIEFEIIDQSGNILKQKLFPSPGYNLQFSNFIKTSDGKFILPGVEIIPPANDSVFVIKINSNLEPDSFYRSMNHYDYLCNQTIPKTGRIILSRDSENISITFPPLPPIPGPGTYNVYPNPTTGFITITCDPNIKIMSTKVYDLTGRIVKTIKTTPDKSGNAGINLQPLAPGCYILQSIIAGNKCEEKLIVE